MTRSARIASILGVLALGWALFLVLHGGYDATVAGIRIRTNSPRRLVWVAAFAYAYVAYSLGVRRTLAIVSMAVAWPLRTLRRLDPRVAAVLLAVAVTAAGIRWGAKSAGGADSYGYVSQAELWLSGQLRVAQPWMTRAPWPEPTWTFSPLGYRPGVDRESIVPRYAAGLPMLMAAAKKVGGQPAVFWVVPICGGLLTLATFGIGRRLGRSSTGLLAAFLVGISPVLLTMLMQPMSDVPVAAAWTIAFWCLLAPGPGWALAAGAATAAAILIRPNLVPMAAIPALWLLFQGWRGASARRPALIRVVCFAFASAAGMAATAALNNYWYGSPFRSGYDTLDVLFDRANIVPNMKLFAAWMYESHTIVGLAAVAALVVPARWLWPPTPNRRAVPFMAAFAIAVWFEYCLYVPFDAWWYLRFLLPCFPYMMLGLAAIAMKVIDRVHPAWGTVILCVCLVWAGRNLQFSDTHYVFSLQKGEEKYQTVGRIVRSRTEANAVVFSMQHSGSIRYYGGRMTFAFNAVSEIGVDEAVAWFSQHGAHPYAVLEDWEVPQFRAQFGRSALGRLEMKPLLVYRSNSTVFLYDLLRPAGDEGAVETIFEQPGQRIHSLPPAPPPQFVLRF